MAKQYEVKIGNTWNKVTEVEDGMIEVVDDSGHHYICDSAMHEQIALAMHFPYCVAIGEGKLLRAIWPATSVGEARKIVDQINWEDNTNVFTLVNTPNSGFQPRII